jgi:predicted Zn-dependent protease
MKLFLCFLSLLLVTGCFPTPQKNFESLGLVFLHKDITQSELQALVKRIESSFYLTVTAREESPDFMEAAFVKERNQYDAAKILENDALFEKQKPGEYLLLFTDKDIFEGETNFLLSHSDMIKRRTIISTYRLGIKNSALPAGTQVRVDRLYKILLRRIGAASNLWSDQCVMAFSNSLEELDQRPDTYCEEDAATLRKIKLLK